MASYLKAGASAVVLSDAIFDKTAADCGDYSTIERRTRTALRERSEVREMLSTIK